MRFSTWTLIVQWRHSLALTLSAGALNALTHHSDLSRTPYVFPCRKMPKSVPPQLDWLVDSGIYLRKNHENGKNYTSTINSVKVHGWLKID